MSAEEEKGNMGKGRRADSGGQWATACVGMTLMLAVTGGGMLCLQVAYGLGRWAREHVGMTLVMERSVTDGEAERIVAGLEGGPGVREAVYVSAARALEEHCRDTGSDPQEFLGYNPFEACVEVWPEAEYASPDSMEALGRRWMEQWPGVKGVEFDRDLAGGVDRKVGLMEAGLLLAALVLGCIAWALTDNTVRLAVYAERRLIRIMRLVGADDRTVGRPYVRKSVLTGAVAALLAIGMMWLGVAVLLDRWPELAEIVTPRAVTAASGVVAVTGVGVAWASARRAVWKSLTAEV